MLAQLVLAAALTASPASAPPVHVGAYNLVVGVTNAQEDEIGWNCFTDGNFSCGGEDVALARGFARASWSPLCVWYRGELVNGGRYVMCSDGSVYVKNWSRSARY